MIENLAALHAATNVSHVTTLVTAEQIAAWISARWPERGEVEISRFQMAQGGGCSSIIIVDFAQSSRPDRIVLRLQPPDDPGFHASSTWRSSPEMEWAAQVAVQTHAPGVPLAPLLAIEPDPAFIGRPFFAMEFVPGITLPTFGFMSTGPLTTASPDQRRAAMLAVLRHLAAIHAVDPQVPQLSRFHIGRNGRATTLLHLELLAREVDDKLAGRPFSVLRNGLAWLFDHVPDDDRIGITWGDARVGNTILGPDFQPIALLDWEGAAILPTEADLGWWSLYDMVERSQSGDAVLPRVPGLREQLDHYVAVSGRNLRNLAYWEILAAVRTALVIMRTRDRLEQTGLAQPFHLATRFENFSTRFIEARL